MMFFSFYYFFSWLFSCKLISMPMTMLKVFYVRYLSFFLCGFYQFVYVCANRPFVYVVCVYHCRLLNASFNGECACASVRLSIDYRFVLVTATLQHNTHRSWSEYEQQFHTAHRMIGEFGLLCTRCVYTSFFFEAVITHRAHSQTHMHRVYILKTNSNRHLKMHNRNAIVTLSQQNINVST